MKAYRITDWDKNFEKSDTRKCKTMYWVALPNKHDGNGFGRVAAHEKACELFTAFVLMVQVASKMPERGLLVDNGKPLTAEDLAFKTRYPRQMFKLAMRELIKPEIGWLEVLNG